MSNIPSACAQNQAEQSVPPQMSMVFPIDTKTTKQTEDEKAYEEYVQVWRKQLEQNWQGGYTQMPDEIAADPTLSPRAKHVYRALLSFMWRKSDRCWPSQETLAASTGYSVRTVIRGLKDLYERGYIERWRRGQGDTNYYFINPLSFVKSFKPAMRGRGVRLQVRELHQFTVESTPAPDVLNGICQVVTSENATVTDPELPSCQTNHTKKPNHTNTESSISSNHSTVASGSGVAGAAIRKANNEPASSTPTTTRTEGTNPSPTTQPQSKTNQNEKQKDELAAPRRAKEALTNKMGNPHGGAEQIALATGIPAEHLKELGVVPERKKRPVPDFIQWYLADYSRDLGDNPRSAKSSVTRATKLYYWACDCVPDVTLGGKKIDFQADPEGVFTTMLQLAKSGAQNVTKVKYHTGPKPNRMPAFFACLENLFDGLSPEERAYVRSDEPLYQRQAAS